MSEPYFLESERLGFRVWNDTMENLAVQLWGNEDVTKLIGGPFSPSRVHERLKSEIRNYDLFKVQYWPIFIQVDATFVGCCGLRPRGDPGVYELGFHLVPSAWGKGFAQEAARCICQYAFQSISAVSLFAGHNPGNLNSKKVLEKLGFTFTHEEFYEPTGLQHPCYILRNPALDTIRPPSPAPGPVAKSTRKRSRGSKYRSEAYHIKHASKRRAKAAALQAGTQDSKLQTTANPDSTNP
jgi:RimJ/RimL family protein N-acetyltransferase